MGEKSGATFQAPPLMEMLLMEGDSSWLPCTQRLGCSVHFLLQILLNKPASDIYLNHIVHSFLKTSGVLCSPSQPERT